MLVLFYWNFLMADIDTGSGGAIGGSVDSGGDFTGRDHAVGRDHIGRDHIDVSVSMLAKSADTTGSQDLARRVQDLEIAVFGDRRTGYVGAVAWVSRLRHELNELDEKLDAMLGRQNSAQFLTLLLAAVSAIATIVMLAGS